MKWVDFSMYHQFFCTFLIAWVIFINAKKVNSFTTRKYYKFLTYEPLNIYKGKQENTYTHTPQITQQKTKTRFHS